MRDRRSLALTASILAVILIVTAAAPHQEAVPVETPGGTIHVVVADTPEERRTGLMNRSTVPKDGMLFVYPQPSPLTFWMKDTEIPLDIVFISDSGTVLNVETANPEPGVPPEDLTRYHSAGVAMYALEVEQGRAEELGLEPGATVSVQR